MEKIFKFVSAFFPWTETNLKEWDDSVKTEFRPFFSSPSAIDDNLSLLRVELINLARISPVKQYVELLEDTLSLYRSQLLKDETTVLAFMANKLYLAERSDSAWMSLSQTFEPLAPKATVYDRVFHSLSILDAMLEGCFKPRFEFLCCFAVRESTGSFPLDSRRLDFGAMRANFPQSLAVTFAPVLNDPLFGLGVNQWRNIAAHKTFMIRSPNEIELQYGLRVPPNTQIVSEEDLTAITNWVIGIHGAVRLASVILYLDNMRKLAPYLGSDLNVRLEQSLTILCQNLQLVGFACARVEETGDTFTLTLNCTEEKPRDLAVIHGSQFLDQLAGAIKSDRLTAEKYEYCAVKVFSPEGLYLGKGLIRIVDAISKVLGQLTLEEYVDRIKFEVQPEAKTDETNLGADE